MHSPLVVSSQAIQASSEASDCLRCLTIGLTCRIRAAVYVRGDAWTGFGIYASYHPVRS